MSTNYIIQSLVLVCIVSGVPLLVATVTGLLAAIIQAATQIQEQSIGYLVKLVSVVCTLFIFSGWITDRILVYCREILVALPVAGK